MHLHGFPFFLLLVTTCSADSSDECCKAKTVGDVSYTFSRVITENDSNFDQAASCINKCVYRNTKSGNEFCFKSGDLMVECNRMSQATMKNNARMVTDSAKSAMKKLTTQFGKLDNFTTVQEKFEWAQMYMPNMPVMYNNTMDMFDAMMGKQRMEDPMAKKAKDFVKRLESDLEGAGDSIGSINEVIDKHMKELTNIPDEDNTVLEFQMYSLEAAKAMVKFISPKSNGGDGGVEMYFNSLVANTNSFDMTIDILMKTRGFLSWIRDVVGGVAVGAAGGCIGGLFAGGLGCPYGAAVGAAAGAAGGVITATDNELKKQTGNDECFSGDSMIETVLGLKRISELRIGDKVRTSRHEISLFTEFLGWLDRSSKAPSSMLQIRTLSGPAITLTGSHLIFSNSTPRFTRELRAGDSLMHWNGSGMEDAEIVDIRSVTTYSGYWAPLTTEGTLLVDGFLASCYASFPHQVSSGFLASYYASFPHQVSDFALTPVKMLPRLLLDDEDSQHEDGVRSYAKMLIRTGELGGLKKEQPSGKKAATTMSSFSMMAGLSHNTEL